MGPRGPGFRPLPGWHGQSWLGSCGPFPQEVLILAWSVRQHLRVAAFFRDSVAFAPGTQVGLRGSYSSGWREVLQRARTPWAKPFLRPQGWGGRCLSPGAGGSLSSCFPAQFLSPWEVNTVQRH